MFERYTESARVAIFMAREEASARGDTSIATEHLLIGLLRADDSGLRNILSPSINADTIRRELPKVIGATAVHTIDLPLSDESKRALTHGMDEADRKGDRHIGCEHLLLGLMCEDRFSAARLLKALGISREQIGQEVAPENAATPITRSDLHTLVDSLPDGAIKAACRTLQQLQVWPPPAPDIPARIAEPQQEVEQRGHSSRSRNCGIGGGSWSTNAAGELRDGSYSFSRVEDGVTIHETHRFYRGQEITTIERLRLSGDGKSLAYVQQITGPKIDRRQEIDFDLS